MTDRELAAQYKVSRQTIISWRKKAAPFSDPVAMPAFIASQHTRRGVSKYSPRDTIEILPPINVPASSARPASPEATDEGTLQRLAESERIAYQRYVDSGGSERAGQLWLLIADQKRKAEEQAAKLGNDATEAESKLVAATIEVIATLNLHLATLPKLMGLMCEGCDQDDIATKIQSHLEQTIKHAIGELFDTVIKGTPLEQVYPNPESDDIKAYAEASKLD